MALLHKGASQVPIRTYKPRVNLEARGTGTAGMLLQVRQICEQDNMPRENKKLDSNFARQRKVKTGEPITRVGEGIPTQRRAYPPGVPGVALWR